MARSAFEAEPLASWVDSVATEPGAAVRAQLELALARVGPPERVRELLERLAALPLDPADIEGTLLRLRTLEVALLRAEGVSEATRERLAATLLAVFPLGSRDADRQLGVLLASLPESHEAFVPRALAQLAAADAAGDGAEAFHWAFVLRGVERGWTSESRKQLFEWLRAAERSFGGGRAVPVFLAALRADALATLTAEERAALGALVEPAADEALAPANPRPFVQAWTVADLEPRLAEVDGERDLGRGQALLRDAACLACHRIEGRGTALGPELDGLAGRFNAADLLESILEPSRAIPERYRDTIVWTHAGHAVAGRIVEEQDGRLWLRESGGARGLASVALDEIESRETSALSPMPEGLLDTFTAEEVLDLLAYLLQDG
jgi:putative heme-binding domain-containing protein